jgi:hypothetical protein
MTHYSNTNNPIDFPKSKTKIPMLERFAAQSLVELDGELIFSKEKFAELIVRECGQWFNNRLTVEPDYGFEHRIERNRAVVGVMKEYNEHFGVEE